MWRPYHVVDTLNLLMPSSSVIKLLSNPRIPINALVFGSSINQNSQVANQLNNLVSGINYYLMCMLLPWQRAELPWQQVEYHNSLSFMVGFPGFC